MAGGILGGGRVDLVKAIRVEILGELVSKLFYIRTAEEEGVPVI